MGGAEACFGNELLQSFAKEKQRERGCSGGRKCFTLDCELDSQALLSISSCGRKLSALHVNSSDAEPGGGVRQRVSSSEAEGNDGVFCTPDSINVLDFRHPSGVGLKIPKLGVIATSVFSRGDSIFLGCNNARSSGMQQFSLRKQKLFGTYSLPDPESNSHSHYTALTQVLGNSNHFMGVCGLGQYVFDASNDDGLQQYLSTYCSNLQKVRQVIGLDDLYSPSFDYLGSHVLLISRDRPALCRFISLVDDSCKNLNELKTGNAFILLAKALIGIGCESPTFWPSQLEY